MRILDNPKLSVRRAAADLVMIVIEASTGETIACEVSDATAAEWAKTIVDSNASTDAARG